MPNRFSRDASTFQPLAIGFGSCIASNRITIDGAPIGVMYREAPDNPIDSGWRFLAGDESEEYLQNPQNFSLYDVNTLANYEPLLRNHLDAPPGTSLTRTGQRFRLSDKLECPRE